MAACMEACAHLLRKGPPHKHLAIPRGRNGHCTRCRHRPRGMPRQPHRKWLHVRARAGACAQPAVRPHTPRHHVAVVGRDQRVEAGGSGREAGGAGAGRKRAHRAAATAMPRAACTPSTRRGWRCTSLREDTA